MNKKILFIDPNEHYVQTIIPRLFSSGYRKIAVAQSAKQGFDLIKTFHPELVVIDTHLDDLDGYRLCRHIKNVYGHEVHVILTVGLTEKYDPSKAEIVEADDYIVKTNDCLPVLVAIKRQISEIQQHQFALN